MAKRINLQRIIEAEIEKGNVYIADNGNFLSKDNLERGMMDDFKRGLTDGSIPVSTSFEAYQNDRLSHMRSAEDVLKHINNFFGNYEKGVEQGSEAGC